MPSAGQVASAKAEPQYVPDAETRILVVNSNVNSTMVSPFILDIAAYA
jgi:hypothetical protein